MWILVWLAVAQTGAVTSGSAAFDTKDACTRAWVEMEKAQARLRASLSQAGQRGSGMTLQTLCLNRQTGVPD
jgi:hypothetical protein